MKKLILQIIQNPTAKLQRLFKNVIVMNVPIYIERKAFQPQKKNHSFGITVNTTKIGQPNHVDRTLTFVIV